MCSRFENKDTGESIFKMLKKDFAGKFIIEDVEETKQVNIAPTNNVLVITSEDDSYHLKEMNWGIQFNKEKKSPLIFNSRIETIKDKKFWTQLFYKNRCLLPATSFYEWKEIGKVKIPHRISLIDDEVFFFPSIFTLIDNVLKTSMITTSPNSFMKNIHRRMPAIIKKEKSLNFLTDEPLKALEYCQPLNNKEKMKIEIAENILTRKQKESLEKI